MAQPQFAERPDAPAVDEDSPLGRQLKRVLVDKWETERALKEAQALGLAPGQAMEQFALDYIKSHKP